MIIRRHYKYKYKYKYEPKQIGQKEKNSFFMFCTREHLNEIAKSMQIRTLYIYPVTRSLLQMLCLFRLDEDHYYKRLESAKRHSTQSSYSTLLQNYSKMINDPALFCFAQSRQYYSETRMAGQTDNRMSLTKRWPVI